MDLYILRFVPLHVRSATVNLPAAAAAATTCRNTFSFSAAD